jgi:CRP-like cAMP-binding protein
MTGALLRRALGYRDFRLLLAGNAVSATGNWLYSVALVVFVFDATRSAAWVAAAAVVRLVPYVVFAGAGGAIADRFFGRRLLVICDVLRGVLMLALAAMVAAGAPVVAVLVVTAVTTTVSTVYRPALVTLTPTVVRDEDLAAANTVSETVENLALLVGPAVGGLLAAVGPPSVAFAVNAATFFVAAVLVSRLAVRSGDQSDEYESLLSRMVDGYRAVLSDTDVTVLMLMVVGAAFVYGQESVLWVFASQQLLGTGAAGLGYLLTAAGAGGMMGAVVTARIADRVPPGLVLLLSAFGLGIPLALLAAIRTPALAYAVVLIEGAAAITIDVLAVTTLQRVVGTDRLAKVFGVIDGVAVMGLLLGTVVASAVASRFGVQVALVAGGVAFPLLAVALSPKLVGISRRAAQRKRELADRVELLSRLRILDGASPATLESIAAHMRPQVAVPPDILIAEGAAADDLYVVADGEFDVVTTAADGGPERLLNRLGPGDYFGEIGVLRPDQRRTATVRTTSRGIVYRISGDRFRDAVQQISVMPTTLVNGMAARLARSAAAETRRLADPPQAA